MNKLFGYADEYIAQSDWKVLAMLKFCLCAMGILIGMAIPQKCRKAVVPCAMAVFFVTYVPLMLKFLRIVLAGDKRA